MTKHAAAKIAQEYYNIGARLALGHTKQASKIDALRRILKEKSRAGINLGTGIGLGAAGANIGLKNVHGLLQDNIPLIARSEFKVGDKALDAFQDFMFTPQLDALGVNWYGNTLPILFGAAGGAGLGIQAAKKLNLGKKLVG